MRKITFIGNLEARFGARYKKILDPEVYQDGRNLSRLIAKDKKYFLDPDKLDRVNAELRSLQKDGQGFNKGLSYEIDKKNDNSSRSFNKKSNNAQSNGLVAPKDRKDRIKSLKTNQEIRKNRAYTSKPTTEWPKNPKIDFDKPNVVFEKKPPTKSTHVMPTNKVKLSMKRKIGLGAVGLVATGAIGYGLYRKIRSDKGKKRK